MVSEARSKKAIQLLSESLDTLTLGPRKKSRYSDIATLERPHISTIQLSIHPAM